MRVALAGLALILPGLCWLVWLAEKDQDKAEILAMILGVSFSLPALLALVFYILHIQVNSLWLAAYIVLFGVILLLGLWRQRPEAPGLQWLWALLGFTALVGWRLWQARTLVLPNWVDSVHHVLIVRKMIETGGLSSNLQPYLPGVFYYHYGFHALSAFFSALAGWEPAQTVLWFGQLINAAVSLSVYAFTRQWSGNWKTALLAGLFSAFVAKMPGFYLSWGRYTFLLAMALLPLAMAQAYRLMKGGGRWQSGIALTLLVVGVLLSHYVAAFLLLLFLFILGGWQILNSAVSKQPLSKGFKRLFTFSFLGGLLALPWYLKVILVYKKVVASPFSWETTETLGNTEQWNYLRYIIGTNAALVITGLAVMGLAWLVFRKKGKGFGVWSLLVTLLAFPLGWKVLNFHNYYFGLMLFFPISGLAAWGIVAFSQALKRKLIRPNLTQAVALSLVALLLLLGFRDNFSALNPDTVLAGREDIEALQWIDTHVPAKSRFFINVVPWGYGMVRGVDGGMWALPLTGRWTVAPTIYYPFGKDQETTRQWKAWGERAAAIKACDEDFWALVKEAELDYAYLSVKAGNLQPLMLESCPGANKIYQASGVSVWLLNPELADGK